MKDKSFKKSIAYTAIEQAIYSHNNKIAINSTIEKICDAIRQVMRNNPDIFWFAHQYHFDEATSTVQFHYTFSKERVKTIQRSIYDVITNDFCLEYVRRLTIWQQVMYVYKWLVTYCNYNVNSAYNQCIYSVFVRRNSVCTGYAKSAQYLFNLLGIKSILVFGRLNNDKEEGRHCWNLIEIEGKYFHFDACFGDSILDDIMRKIGISKPFKINGINYNFFCTSTNKISHTRSIEDKTSLPLAERSLTAEEINELSNITIKTRKEKIGCLLSNIGSSADIYACTKDKNIVLKVFRQDSSTSAYEEYHYMQQTKGCKHLIQCNEDYSDAAHNIIALEQATPVVDLLCSHYYRLTWKGLLKMATDIALAWMECQKNGVLYRDIHICNIYRANDGTFKLGDFGSCTNNFSAKERVGNRWFMAPETYTSGKFTESSAIYSISMVIYFISNKLQPAFWQPGHESEAIEHRIYGKKLPLPYSTKNLPLETRDDIKMFFISTLAAHDTERWKDIHKFVNMLQLLSRLLNKRDTIAYESSIHIDKKLFNIDSLDKNLYRISEHIPIKYMCIKSSCINIVTATENKKSSNVCPDYVIDTNPDGEINYALPVDEIEDFARTMACMPDINYNTAPSYNWEEMNSIHATENSIFSTTYISDEPVSYQPLYSPNKPGKIPFWKNILHKIKKDRVFACVFAPAEIRRKSHLLIQIYLHLYEEAQLVHSLAVESDKNATRRDYIPLQIGLQRNDKVKIELNLWEEGNRIMHNCKTIVWKGTFSKCSFDYFIPQDFYTDEVSCEINLYVNDALIGDMRFITIITNAPRNLSPEIISKTFKKIFISYAHLDIQKVKNLALAYKAQGVDYFFDRDKLCAGDVYEEKIFNFIDTSDLFILCWSQNAAQSSYVAKEKKRALMHAYPQQSYKEATLKIYPISIEPRAPLPEDMKEIYNFEIL